MENKISYYQRLLAMDQDEAVDILEDFLKNNPRERAYDEVLMPALSYAKEDRRRGNLSEREEQVIFDATRQILEDFPASEPHDIAASQDGSPGSPADSGLRKIRLLGCPAHDEADEIGLLMLRQLLDPTRYQVEIIPAGALASEITVSASEKNAPLICIAALAPGGVAQARYLCKRLRALFPEVKIVVGRWAFSGALDETSLLSAGADQIGISLLQTRDQITNLRQLISDSETPPASPGLSLS